MTDLDNIDAIDKKDSSRGDQVRLYITFLLVAVMVFAYPMIYRAITGQPMGGPPPTNKPDAGGDPKSETKADAKPPAKADAPEEPKDGPTGGSKPGEVVTTRRDELTGLRVRLPPTVADSTVTLGATGDATRAEGLDRSTFCYQARLRAGRASLEELRLTDFADRVRSVVDYSAITPAAMPMLTPLAEFSLPGSGRRTPAGDTVGGLAGESLAVTRLVIDGQDVALGANDWSMTAAPAVQTDGSVRAVFRLIVERPAAKPLAMEKTVTAWPRQTPQGTPSGLGHTLSVDFRVVFPDDKTHAVEFDFVGPVGVPEENSQDIRRVIWGRRNEANRETRWFHTDFGELKKRHEAGTPLTVPDKLDPAKGDTPENVWYVGVANRFFVAVVVPDRLVGQRDATELAPAEWKAISLRRMVVPVEAISGRAKQDYFAPVMTVAAEVTGSWRRGYRVMVGPKTAATFTAVEDALRADLSLDGQIQYAQFCCCPVDVGCDTIIGGLIGKPLLKLMDLIYSVIPNYGIAIIVMVLLVRLVVYPISRRGTMSMMRMKDIQPKMAELQAKYANDRERMQSELMELYRKEGINPFGSFMPMLLQMPVWIGLWGALSAAVNLRHAPFFGWIRDLAGEDALVHLSEAPVLILPLCGTVTLPASLNLLPLVTAVAMFAQQQMMTPATPKPTAPVGPDGKPTGEAPVDPNPIDPRLMGYMFSGMFMVMLYSAPAGLNLYILTSMVFGFGENWYVKRQYEDLKARGLLTPKPDSKPGFFGRLIDEVRKMQQQQEKLPSREEESGGGRRGKKR